MFAFPWISQDDEEEEEEEEHESENLSEGSTDCIEFWGPNAQDMCGKCEDTWTDRNPPAQKWFAKDPTTNTVHTHVWCSQCWQMFDKTDGKKYADLGILDKDDAGDLLWAIGPPQGCLYIQCRCVSYDL